ncbi:MAG: TolC family protein [Lentisphaeraceae bacterium]|nr:TolC family protein [Lentisphaeraceae bacterium]
MSQAVQRELDARARWINAEKNYLDSLDSFKFRLGIPTDSKISLERKTLENLSEKYIQTLNPEIKQKDYNKNGENINLIKPTRIGGGQFEFKEEIAIKKALQKRLDLQVLYARVIDTQRKIILAKDQLGPRLSIVGSYRSGGNRSGSGAFNNDIGLDFRKGVMTAGLDAQLPWDINTEIHTFRQSYLDLQVNLREYQKLEDSIKLQIRDRLRSLIQNRQAFINQSNALALAKRRVDSTNLFLQAGRVAIRDLLEAQDDLIEAQDNLTSAIVSYRLSELALQRDMGTLQVSDNGIVREIND